MIEANFIKVESKIGNIDMTKCYWEISDTKYILKATVIDAFEDEFKEKWSWFSSDEYKEELINYHKLYGMKKLAQALTGDSGRLRTRFIWRKL